MIQPKTKFRFSVQNHDFWQALEGSDHFMPPPYQRAQYDIPTKVRLTITLGRRAELFLLLLLSLKLILSN